MGDEITTLDLVTISVAGYAAIVATVGVGLQGLSWWRGWATRVQIVVRPNMRIHTPGLGGSDQQVVIFEIRNHSAHPIKVVSFGLLKGKRGKGGGWVIPHPRTGGGAISGPFSVPARDSVTLHLEDGALEMTRDHLARAYIATSDGREFTSKAARLVD